MNLSTLWTININHPFEMSLSTILDLQEAGYRHGFGTSLGAPYSMGDVTFARLVSLGSRSPSCAMMQFCMVLPSLVQASLRGFLLWHPLHFLRQDL